MLSSLAAAVTLFTPTPLKFDVVGASLFKNGYAVVVREANIPASGDYVLREIPKPSLGTLWISSSSGTVIESVVSGNETKPSSSPVKDIEELISSNVNKQVTLELHSGGSVTGKIVSAPGSLVVIESLGRQQVMPKGMIRDVLSSDPLSTSVAGSTSSRTLRFRVKAGKNAKLRMLGLESGLTWTPAYAFDISDKKELKLTAKATVVNDLDGISDRLLSLTTGYPNVPYAGAVDPLLADYVGRQIDFTTYDPNDNTLVQRKDMLLQNAAPVMDQMPVATTPGVMSEDLFFYKLPGVTLEKGERGAYVIQEERVPYEHIYTWDISDDFNESADVRPVPKQTQEVWHSLKFTNKADQPLTTGPGTTFKDGQILGQGLLDYTPAGGKGILKITKAMDVSPDANEEEVSRDRGTLKNLNGYAYDLVTVRGTLVIKSSKFEAINMKITKQLTGEVVSADNEGKVVKTAKGLRDVNPHSRIEWTPSVGSGGIVTLAYTYKVYVRD